jgi:hypothetical protein
MVDAAAELRTREVEAVGAHGAILLPPRRLRRAALQIGPAMPNSPARAGHGAVRGNGTEPAGRTPTEHMMNRHACTVLLLAMTATSGAARADSAGLLARAQAANPARYAQVASLNPEIRYTADNKSFTMWWQPSANTKPKGVIVPLHGHGGYGTDGIALWQPYAQKYGYALLSLSWWVGTTEATSDYYTPEEIHAAISTVLKDKGVSPGSVFFNGFSRGSANSYAVAALDAAATGRRYFGLVLSNAGGAMTGYPPNQQIDTGYFGKLPFSGVKWAMYCGELDPNPNQDGCPAMTASRDWVVKHGASMVLFIDDPTGEHGGFMLNSANVETALSTYASLLAAVTSPPTCTLSASPSSIALGGASTLTASCSPGTTAYAWTGGTCAGTGQASCTVAPAASTTYTVMGSTSGGWGALATATVAVADTLAPTVPGGLKATAVDSAQVDLSWTASTDDVGVSGYRVYRDGSQVGSVTLTRYTDGKLSPSTAYSYTVAACDAAGNCSSTSAGVSATTAAASDLLSNAEADCLFDWGEDTYAAELSPRRPPSSTSAPYYYRRYSATQVHLGVSSADNHLYYLDAAGQLRDLGLAAAWSTRAGCR